MTMPFPRTLLPQALALFAALFLTACLAEAGPTLSAQDARDQVQAGTITLIDVRTPGEWRQTGVPVGAALIDMNNAEGPQGFVNAVLAQVKGNRNAPIALICRSGNRSTYMQKVLEDQGFTRVYNIREGMGGSAAGPGWIKQGLPIEACKQC
jgi:rhodanese-related sulfurtransferase